MPARQNITDDPTAQKITVILSAEQHEALNIMLLQSRTRVKMTGFVRACVEMAMADEEFAKAVLAKAVEMKAG